MPLTKTDNKEGDCAIYVMTCITHLRVLTIAKRYASRW